MNKFLKYSLFGIAFYYIIKPKNKTALSGLNGQLYEWKKRMTGREILSLLKKNGWTVDRIKGSHYICKKNNISVTIPLHGNKSIGIGLYVQIKKDIENAENNKI